jgi:Antidote-toxin recognition MazE, bacterial antitoxin
VHWKAGGSSNPQVYTLVYILTEKPMPSSRTAKLFKNGASQAVRLPAEFRLPGKEVSIRRDDKTGDVILSPRTSLGRLL